MTSKLNSENIKNETTQDLMNMYVRAKNFKTFAYQSLNNAIRLDVTDKKLNAAKNNYESAKIEFSLILNELKARGVTKVVAN